MSNIVAIKKLSPWSLGKVFCIYYFFWGITFGIVYLFQGQPSIYAPLGFVTLFLSVKLNLRLYAQDNLLSKLGFAFWSLPCYAVSGWLTGFLGAFLYNWGSRFLQLRIYGESSTEPPADVSPRR